jgi:hypothetical protein
MPLNICLLLAAVPEAVLVDLEMLAAVVVGVYYQTQQP